MSDGNEGSRGGLSRRSVLRGLGVTLALPWMESALGVGSRALGAGQGAAAGAGSAGAAASPVRMACVFFPNGVNYDAWMPAAKGSPIARENPAGVPMKPSIAPTLDAIAGVRSEVSVLTGLTLHHARANGDGPGDHARSSASFLTGHQARKTAGNDIRIGVSVDQFAARQIGRNTRLPSLEIGCEHGPAAGNCDSGYSCAYSSNISWREEDVPMPKVVDPGMVFERMFGSAAQAAQREERLARRQSILDFVRDDARRLRSSLGVQDQRKLDQYQEAVREVEGRIQRARLEADPMPDSTLVPKIPEGVPRKISEHIDLMYDLLLLAFQTDTTRLATFMLAVDGSNRAFPEIGIKDGHHHLSHHQNNEDMITKIRAIDRFYADRFARFIQRMKDTPDGTGSLLDHSMILYGGGISDGNKHNHEDLPILLAGRGGAGDMGLKPGGTIACGKETPLCNLYLSMLDRLGCEVESFGDSTGRLAGL